MKRESLRNYDTFQNKLLVIKIKRICLYEYDIETERFKFKIRDKVTTYKIYINTLLYIHMMMMMTLQNPLSALNLKNFVFIFL